MTKTEANLRIAIANLEIEFASRGILIGLVLTILGGIAGFFTDGKQVLED